MCNEWQNLFPRLNSLISTLKKTSQGWRAIGDTAFHLTCPGMEPPDLRTAGSVFNHYIKRPVPNFNKRFLTVILSFHCGYNYGSGKFGYITGSIFALLVWTHSGIKQTKLTAQIIASCPTLQLKKRMAYEKVQKTFDSSFCLKNKFFVFTRSYILRVIGVMRPGCLNCIGR